MWVPRCHRLRHEFPLWTIALLAIMGNIRCLRHSQQWGAGKLGISIFSPALWLFACCLESAIVSISLLPQDSAVEFSFLVLFPDSPKKSPFVSHVPNLPLLTIQNTPNDLSRIIPTFSSNICHLPAPQVLWSTFRGNNSHS